MYVGNGVIAYVATAAGPVQQPVSTVMGSSGLFRWVDIINFIRRAVIVLLAGV